MFSIGEFARLANVSPRTLRYYEEIGLLAPAAVDTATGYRSYSAYQLSRVHRIVALKDLGLSLEQLRPLLDDLSAGQLEGMLRLKRAELPPPALRPTRHAWPGWSSVSATSKVRTRCPPTSS